MKTNEDLWKSMEIHKILRKSSWVKLSSSTLIGNLPCNSGIKSDGFDRWNAPAAINNMWSVLITPYLVVTEVPSTIGN